MTLTMKTPNSFTMKTIADAHKLLQLLPLLESSIHQVIGAWAQDVPNPDPSLASRELFNARRIILSAVGVLTELVSDPSSRLLELSSQYNESRALHIMASLRMPEILEEGGRHGVGINELSKKVGIETDKLCMYQSDFHTT
jgi:hypothetical protein